MYGGNVVETLKHVSGQGLSPCVRGKRNVLDPAGTLSRSIPVCTGETPIVVRVNRITQVYPRVYGGNKMRNKGLMILKGLSPCVRGKLIQSTPNIKWSRSIPVCTGETHRRSSIQPAHRVYPRVYGGNCLLPVSRHSPGGLSPCVRGKRIFPKGDTTPRRSIPVCTGETLNISSPFFLSRVYPRVYGGNGKKQVT